MRDEKQKKHYFVSDLHLGMFPASSSQKREKLFVQWLDSVAHDAEAIYLVGDIFDYWWEYKKVAPKGFVRTLGKLADLSDQGVALHFFVGNHDIWTFGYLEQELGMTIHRKPLIQTIQGKTFYIAHGDGLGKGDHLYKFLRACFHNPVLQRLFALLHPDIALSIGHAWANKSSQKKKGDAIFWGEDKELLFQHARAVLQDEPIDYFVFGHRHIPLISSLNKDSDKESTIVYLGDWIKNFTYGVYQNGKMGIEKFTDS